MPSLDDIPTLPPATLSGDDLFAVVDGNDRRSPRRATLSALKTFTLSDVGALTIGVSFPVDVNIGFGEVYIDSETGNLKVSGYPIVPPEGP